MKRKQILFILIPTFIFVVIWIISSIYHGLMTSTISQNENMQITPISPNFDIKVIDNLKQRKAVTPIYEISGSSVIPSPPTQITPTPIGSQSAKVASQGGALTP